MLIRGILLALFAGTAHAGTVTTMTFGDSAPAEVVVANGVEARATSGFVVYGRGAWSARPSAIVPGPDRSIEAAASGETFGRSDAIVYVSSSCTLQTPLAHRGLAAKTIASRSAYWPLVRDAECRHALPPGLLDAVVLQESHYRPFAVSPAGAGGLAQLMPRTAIGLGVVDRFEPASNIDGGARYLRSMLDHYRSVPLALAAYNAGRGSVDRWRGIPLNRETPGYVAKVLGFFNEVDLGTTPCFQTAVSYAVSLTFGNTTDN